MKLTKEKMRKILEIVCDMTNEPIDGNLGYYTYQLDNEMFYIVEWNVGIANYNLMNGNEIIDWLVKNVYINENKVLKLKEFLV